MTAESLIERYQKQFEEDGVVFNLSTVMLEFAQYHVNCALEAAAEQLPYDDRLNQDFVLKAKILKAYPKNMIK